MIPNGLNPHGLEDRTLTFYVLEGDEVVFTCESTNRLYCWADFPTIIKQYVMDSYGKSESEVLLASEQAPDQQTWDALQKYSSKEQPLEEGVKHFMVQGNQPFYYQTWSASAAPDFATVYVLDTSGSMQSGDYTQVKYGIAGEIWGYNSSEYTTHKSRMYMYSAQYLDTMEVNKSLFGSIPFGNATVKEICQAVFPFVNGIARGDEASSESMITNLYFSISNIVKRMFEKNAVTIGKNCALSAVSFILLTDESIFTSDTLYGVGALTNSSSKWYSEWFKTWQRQSSSSSNLFPTNGTYNDEDRKTFCQAITDALRQMSYYYGVNFTWGLYGGLVTNTHDTTAVKTNKTATWLNKVNSISTVGNWSINYQSGKPWTIPSNFHVANPHEPMCRISLKIPKTYVTGTSGALKSAAVMVYNNQFNKTNVLARFHSEPNEDTDTYWEYSAFRFLRTYYDGTGTKQTMVDKVVTLPTVGNMYVSSGTYHWETTGQSPEYPTTTVSCGGSYNVDYKDLTANTSRPTITFVLVKD